MRWLALVGAAAFGGCALVTTDRPAARDVTWRPFTLVHIAHPDLGTPAADAGLERAAAAVAADRWVDAVVVSGRLGTATAARIAERLASARRPVLVVDPSGPPVRRLEPLQGLTLLAVPAQHAREAAAELRDTEARLFGRLGCVVLDAPLDARDGARPAATDLAYALEAIGRIRLVLVAGDADDLGRRGGLITLTTGPLAGGSMRVVALSGRHLETWLRRLEPAPGEPADQPRAEAEVR